MKTITWTDGKQYDLSAPSQGSQNCTIDGQQYAVKLHSDGETQDDGNKKPPKPPAPTPAPTPAPKPAPGPTPTPVVQPPVTAAGAPVIPADAKVVDMLNPQHPWQMNHDPGTPGSASGTTSYPVTAPDGTPNCRLFQFSGSGHGGEIYHTHALDNSGTYNTVCYETLEYMDAASIAAVAQFERDSEHVDPDGTVHDLAMQISHGIIEITGNRHWQTTGIHVPDRQPNTWVVSKRYERDNGDGTCTYIGYEQDGVFYPINHQLPQVGGSKWAGGIWNVQYQANVKQDGVQVSIYSKAFNLHFWKS